MNKTIEEQLNDIFTKHTVALTKTGDKDFNPPEIVSFDVIVCNVFEASKDILALIKNDHASLSAAIEKEKQFTIKKEYQCAKCGRYYDKDDVYCTIDRAKLEETEYKYEESSQESFNAGLELAQKIVEENV